MPSYRMVYIPYKNSGDFLELGGRLFVNSPYSRAPRRFKILRFHPRRFSEQVYYVGAICSYAESYLCGHVTSYIDASSRDHCRAFQFLRRSPPSRSVLSGQLPSSCALFAYSTRVHDVFPRLRTVRTVFTRMPRVNYENLPIRAMFTVTGHNDVTNSDPPCQIRSEPSRADSECCERRACKIFSIAYWFSRFYFQVQVLVYILGAVSYP